MVIIHFYPLKTSKKYASLRLKLKILKEKG